MMTHMCIDSTTRAAAELGYEPILIEDITATCNLEYNGQMAEAKDVQNAFISALSNFAVVTTTTEFYQTENNLTFPDKLTLSHEL